MEAEAIAEQIAKKNEFVERVLGGGKKKLRATGYPGRHGGFKDSNVDAIDIVENYRSNRSVRTSRETSCDRNKSTERTPSNSTPTGALIGGSATHRPPLACRHEALSAILKRTYPDPKQVVADEERHETALEEVMDCRT